MNTVTYSWNITMQFDYNMYRQHGSHRNILFPVTGWACT